MTDSLLPLLSVSGIGLCSLAAVITLQHSQKHLEGIIPYLSPMGAGAMLGEVFGIFCQSVI